MQWSEEGRRQVGEDSGGGGSDVINNTFSKTERRERKETKIQKRNKKVARKSN